jgi:hypothetical protein
MTANVVIRTSVLWRRYRKNFEFNEASRETFFADANFRSRKKEQRISIDAMQTK